MDRDYALVVHARAVGENGRYKKVKFLLENFNKNEGDVLAMDSLLF